MDFDYSPKTKDLQQRLLKFMDENIYPAEKEYSDELLANTAAGKRWTPLETIEKLKVKAQAAGLWNLFLPVDSAEASGYHGAGLTNQEYAPLAEIMGRVPWAPRCSTAMRLIPAIWKPLPVMAAQSSRAAGSSPCWKARFARPSP